MKKRFLALLLSLCLTVTFLPYAISAQEEESEAAVVTSSKLDSEKIFEGSVSETDPRFAVGYARVKPTSGETNFPKSNIENKNMTNYLFYQAEKDKGNRTEAVASFYIRCSHAARLDARFYHYIRNSPGNSTNRVNFSVEEENVGKWINISIPLDSFVLKDSSTNKTMSQFLVSNREDTNVGAGKTFDITPVTIYSNSNFPIYADANAMQMQETLSLNMHEKAVLTPIFTAPEGYTAVGEEITYSSDNPLVASVDENGTVTACGEGTANIKAITPSGFVCNCAVISAAAESPDQIAEYTRNDMKQDDDTFTSVYQIISATSTTGKDVRVQIFGNGKNSNGMHHDLSQYIGRTSINSQAVIAFYIKASKSVQLTAKFFKSSSGAGKNKDTNGVAFDVSQADEWQLIKLPLSEFTFDCDDSAKFSRFDIIIPKEFAGGEAPLITVSAIKIYKADPYCAVISDDSEIEAELPQYIAGQTVRFTAASSKNRIPVLSSLNLLQATGKIDTEISAIPDSEFFVFTMPNGAVRLSGDFIDKTQQNISSGLIFGTSENNETAFVSRAYLPMVEGTVGDTVIYNSSEWTIEDIGLLIVPQDLLFADETIESSSFTKAISAMGTQEDIKYIRANTLIGAVDYTVRIKEVKTDRKFVCRTYIKLVSETETKMLLGNIYVK